MAHVGFKTSKTLPPDETGQESAFLKYLSESRRDVKIKMMDGELVAGWIEYYDQNMIRLTRQGAPNLFIFKQQIAYISEDRAPRKPGVGGHS